MAEGWQVYPKVTVEVTTGEAATLLGFDGLSGLEGWKIFKKIGRAFKKVGKVVKKVVKSKVFKIALPIAGAFFAPLALAKIGTVAAKFGPKIARLVGGGKTKGVVVQVAKGVKKVGLVDDGEYRRIQAIVKDPTRAITPQLFRQLTGQVFNQREATGAKVIGGEVQLPVQNQPTLTTTSTIPAKPATAAATGGIPAIALMLPIALLALRK